MNSGPHCGRNDSRFLTAILSLIKHCTCIEITDSDHTVCVDPTKESGPALDARLARIRTGGNRRTRSR
jgi:hypothetical protein